MSDGDAAGFTNIAAYLPAMARERPHALAIVFPQGRDAQGRVSYTHLTYRQLDEDSDRLARGFEKSGIGRGVRTVLMVKPSLEFFSLTFALFKVGAVPVMVDPGIGLKSLKQCLGEAQPAAFVGIPKAHTARRLFGWARSTLRTHVTVGGRALLGGLTLDDVREAGRGPEPYVMAATSADDVAAILFTSGSTGVPKGVVYRHVNFVAQVEMIRRTYGITPGEIDLPTFPLFALFDPALGMTAIIPDMDASKPAEIDPNKVFEAIENFGVTNMFGSPAVIDRVGRAGAAQGRKLPTLKRVLSAGAPVQPAILQRFQSMLSPGVQIFTPYGATESMPVASIGSAEILGDTRHGTDGGQGICVGKPVDGIELSIVAITDEPIAAWSDASVLKAGEIGEIVVRGAPVTHAYYRRDQATTLAKIPGSDGLRHRMGDLGRFDEQGRLWFCGRKSHRVTTAAGTLFTEPCEGVFNAHPRVYRTALVGVQRGPAKEAVVCVELEKDAGDCDRAVVLQELLVLGSAYPHTRGLATFLFHPRFPVDIRHNAKIFREKLAAWAAKELA